MTRLVAISLGSGEKTCAQCGQLKPLGEFHRQKSAKFGRHSWCKCCYNLYARSIRNKRISRETKRRWDLRSRYGLTPADVDAMLARQSGLCVICKAALPPRYHIDHCHKTGRVRGILCHGCNLKLPIVENAELLAAALAYLRREGGHALSIAV